MAELIEENIMNITKVDMKAESKSKLRRELPLHMMLLIPGIFVLIFSYGSMVGIIMAFQDYIPGKGWYVFGSDFVGIENFKALLTIPNMLNVLWNTVFIALLKIISGLFFPLTFALLLNELKSVWFKRGVQTAVFLPYFVSWVIMAGILIDLLSPAKGIFVNLFAAFGLKVPFFLGDNNWFPTVLVVSNLWKDAGYGMVIYLAAITNINPSLYEAATIDGCGYMKKVRYITLPSLAPVIILLSVLSMGSILNAGFEQVFNLYSPVVYQSGDILDTFVYRMGISEGQYSLSTAVGLFKSVVSLSLISLSYYVAYKVADYRIF